MNRKFSVLFCIYASLLSATTQAQAPQSPTADEESELTPGLAPPRSQASDNLQSSTLEQKTLDRWSEIQTWYGIVLAVMFVVALLLIFLPQWCRGEPLNDLAFRAYTLTLIVFAALILIIMGWSDQQLAPMFGLLGALAGYVFGDRHCHRKNMGDKPPST